MAKIVLSDVAGGYNLSNINSNFQLIEDELNDKVLYRNNPGAEPNTLVTDLDVNGRRVYNLPIPSAPHEAARLQDVTSAINGASSATLISFEPTPSISSTNVQTAIQEVRDDAVTLLAGIWESPGTLGSTTPNTGAFTTISTTDRATVERIRTAGAVATIPTGIATTLFTITAGKHGLYDVVAYANSSGNTAAYTSIGKVIWDGSGGRLIADSGSDLVLSLSANDVKVLQVSGSNLDVTWRYTYMG